MNVDLDTLCAYVEDLLPTKQRREVEAALGEDEQLAATAAAVAGLFDNNIALPTPPVPDHLIELTLATLETEGLVESSPVAVPPHLVATTLARLEDEALVESAAEPDDQKRRSAAPIIRLWPWLRAAAAILLLCGVAYIATMQGSRTTTTLSAHITTLGEQLATSSQALTQAQDALHQANAMVAKTEQALVANQAQIADFASQVDATRRLLAQATTRESQSAEAQRNISARLDEQSLSIEELSTQLAVRDDHHNKALAALRAQHESTVSLLRGEIATLTNQLAAHDQVLAQRDASQQLGALPVGAKNVSPLPTALARQSPPMHPAQGSDSSGQPTTLASLTAPPTRSQHVEALLATHARGTYHERMQAQVRLEALWHELGPGEDDSPTLGFLTSLTSRGKADKVATPPDTTRGWRTWWSGVKD